MGRVYYPRCYAILGAVMDDTFGAVPGDLLDIGYDRATRLVPLRASVNHNGFHQPDTFELEFDFRRLPFSPELIRACEVGIFMFNARSVDEDPEPYFRGDDNLQIVGLVDEAEAVNDGEGYIFRLRGEDYTNLLTNKEWDGRQVAVADRPITEVVQELVDQCTDRDLHGTTLDVVFVNPPGNTDPEPLASYGLSPTKKKKGVTFMAGKTYWEVIQQICELQGCIVYVRGEEVRVSWPHLLIAEAASRRARVAWGRNLERLSITRHYQKQAVPQIECRSWDNQDRLITVRFPEDKNLRGPVPVGSIGTKENEVMGIPVPWVRDEIALRRYAEAYYNARARGETELAYTTYDLEDLEGKSLLALREAEPTTIGFSPLDEELLRKPGIERIRRLMDAGFDASVARALDSAYERLNGFDLPFYARTVAKEWSSEDQGGIQIDVEAVNMIAVDDDPSLEELDARG